MTIALAAPHHAAAPFNGLYYATVATVIPVLFLAIAVQGPAYQDFLKLWVGKTRTIMSRARTSPNAPRSTVGILVATNMIGLAGVIPIFGAAGKSPRYRPYSFREPDHYTPTS